MTKVTYQNRMKRQLRDLVERFGEHHPATARYRNQMERYFKAPTAETDVIMRHNYYSLRKYGKDLEEN